MCHCCLCAVTADLKEMKLERTWGAEVSHMYVLFSCIGVRGCEGGGVNLIPILTQSMATLSKELYL